MGSGPWEDYQPPQGGQSGPWQDYQAPPAAPSQTLAQQHPEEYDPSSQAFQRRYGPAPGGGLLTGNFWRNAAAGAGGLLTDAALAGRQMYAGATGGNTAGLDQEANDKRALDAPLNSTGGAKLGKVAMALPFGFLPGVNTALGSTVLGGAMGALQPTVGNESRGLNTVLGGAAGYGGYKAGSAISSWLTNRAAQPFMGWNQSTANDALAGHIGARDLSPEGLQGVASHISDVYGRARSPNVNIEMTGTTGDLVNSTAEGLSESSKAALTGNKQVADLLGLQPGSNVTAEQLGNISSKLGSKASGEMTSRTGDKELGRALFALKDHVDELVGQSITDPELAAQYSAVNKMYPTWLAMRRGTLFNAGAGNVNPRNFGSYLQKKDFAGYAAGGNDNPLYQMARWGQESRLGDTAPPTVLNFAKWMKYHAVNSQLYGAASGAVSRVGAPASGAIKYGLPVSAPLAVPYLTQ